MSNGLNRLMISRNKSITLMILLAAVATVGISGITATANAKESSCDVSAGGKCVIVAKRGDIEIDKLTIVVGSGSNNTVDLAPINNAISVIQGQIASQSDQIGTVNSQLNTLSAQVANFSDTGITSIEISPVNETVPVPPVDNGTVVPPVDNGTVTNTTTTTNTTSTTDNGTTTSNSTSETVPTTFLGSIASSLGF